MNGKSPIISMLPPLALSVSKGERKFFQQPASYLRPRFLLAIILLVITMSTVAEADCWEDSLKQVDRDILVMASETVYRVVPRDEMTSVFWLPPAHITICDTIVDVGGTGTIYYQIHNSDEAVPVWATRQH